MVLFREPSRREERPEGVGAEAGRGRGSVEVAARRRAGLRLPGRSPHWKEGGLAGRGPGSGGVGSGPRRGAKWTASVQPFSLSLPCWFGLSAILGTVARPPWLPALHRHLPTSDAPASTKLIEQAWPGGVCVCWGREVGGGSSSLQGVRVGEKRAGPGGWWGLGRGRGGSRRKWRPRARPPTAARASSAVSAGLPGPAGLPEACDADGRAERGWSREGAGRPMATKALDPQIQDKGGSFVIPPPGGDGV